MLIEVVKEFSFDAAHFLPQHEGACKRVHGHHYVLQVGFKGGVVSETGMIVDFGDVKRLINPLIIDLLDHQLLNEIEPGSGFPADCPTAERMVEWIVDRIGIHAPAVLVEKLSFVRLYETPTSYAEWRCV